MYCMPAAGLDLEVLAGRSAAKEDALAALRLRFRVRAGEVKRPVSIRSSAELQHRLNFETLNGYAQIARGVHCCSLLCCCTAARAAEYAVLADFVTHRHEQDRWAAGSGTQA